MSEALDLSKKLRKPAKKLRIRGDHYNANRCLEDAELIENVWNEKEVKA